MASYQQNEEMTEDRKRSGFTKQPRAVPAEERSAPGGKRRAKDEGGGVSDLRKKRIWMTVLVDLILLGVLFGVVVGGIFGYRALRDWYAPKWETRDVVFCVEMTGIDPDLVKYGQDGRPTMTGNGIWSSDRTDADLLGTVTSVRTVLVAGADGTNTLTVYLTVEAEAYYREGQGYRMGETMLLAGTEGVFRVKGITAPGHIISMHEKQDETEGLPEDGSVGEDSSETDAVAQG